VAHDVFFTNDAAVALKRGGRFLRARPIHNNLPLTLLTARAGAEPGRYWLARQSSQVTGLMLQSGPAYPAVISRLTKPAAIRLVHDACERGVTLPGVNGDAATAAFFAAQWAEHTKASAAVDRTWRLYEARRGTVPSSVRGHFRIAREADEELIVAWARRFAEEIRDLPARQNARTIGERIAQGRMYLWDHDGPVAMASISPPSASVYRVQLVFTPPAKRGHGYAGALVATLTNRVRAHGGRCCLYADLANPTSSAIYVKIGYRPVAETLIFRFG